MLQIHYWERDKQNQSEKVKVIFVPDTRVHLTNLTSYTPYLVTLTAFNTAGDGPPSDPRGSRTLQSGRERRQLRSLKTVNNLLSSAPVLFRLVVFLQLPASRATCPSQR